MAYAGFALFVLGIVFVIIAPINKKKNARCSAQVQGILVNIRMRHNSRTFTGYMYYYSYCVNGIEYQLKSTVRSKEANEVGDNCTIWYNPKKPEDAQPFRYGSSKVYTIILVIGILMLVAGFFMIVIGLALK